MEARLQKLEIRIPSANLKTLELKDNDKVDLICEDNKLIVSKTTKAKISLAELFNKYTGPNLTKEFVWDKARGRERWYS